MTKLTATKVVRRSILIGAIAYLALFVFNSTTRTGRFSPDSMNYVCVARNIAAGKGVTQPTLGFNQQRISPNDSVPAPLAAHPPLYPLLIALLSCVGISAPIGALALSAFATAFIFIFVYGLAANLYGEEVAVLSAGLLLFYGPLRRMAGYAWTDPVGIALALCSLWLLTKKRSRQFRYLVTVAGLVAGLAFATRYAFFPLCCVGVIFLLIDCAPGQRITSISFFIFGFFVPAGLVWTHNFLATGSIMPPANRAQADFWEAVWTAFRSLFGSYLNGLSSGLQLGLLGLLLGVCAVSLIKGGIARRTRELFFSNRRNILLFWTIVYFIFIIAQRSAWYFGPDRANEMVRIITPAGVVLLVFWAALINAALRKFRLVPYLLVCVLLALSFSREARATVKTPALDFEWPVRNSERLAWLAAYATEKDLIIGDDTVDIPFFLKSRLAVSFSTYPITNYATYDRVISYSHRHCATYRNIYLVLSRQNLSEQQWRTAYGDFFADLVFGHAEKYPNITLVRQLRDASIFIVLCR